MKEFMQNRRGLSTVVTSAIMITAVAILGTAIVTWSNSNLKVFETSLVNTTSSNTNQINENLSIEQLAFCINCGTSNSKNVINVTLTNTGTVSVRITGLQINSTTINSYFTASSSLPANILPQKSYLVSAKLPASKTWGSNKPDTITVTTSRGSIFTTQGIPP